MLRKFTGAAIVCTVAYGVAAPAAAADVTLRFSHFWPAVSTTHKDLFQVWADKVKQDSNGRIAVDIYPSQTLAKAPAQYEAVKSRIADMAATVQGYTANRFPLTQVVELPGVVDNAAHGSCIIQSLYEEGLIADEYKDTRPLFMFTHGPGHLHTTSKAITSPDDLAGLRIRRPTAVVAKILEEVKAQPVGMPAPESYQAMQRGTIDGVSLPWEGAHAFRLNELAKHHTEVGLYTLSFIVTMNKELYEGLPADLKKVIDDNSGKAWTTLAAKVFDDLDTEGRAAAVKAGHQIVTIEGGAKNPAWQPVVERATEAYLAEVEGQGLPARKVYARALELAQTCR
ncbi:TRAP transporter substrate-binding protein [Azospirillum halopraeferens]|uniref:TRAP transporter substrate-binding protein n=1 Tax=Azospirillum halopraeferens TaxID=34010 RepID=UPI0004017056|nr:TRAP transporter substrate-binding protein [Azospirillum halopraeferens]